MRKFFLLRVSNSHDCELSYFDSLELAQTVMFEQVSFYMDSLRIPTDTERMRHIALNHPKGFLLWSTDSDDEIMAKPMEAHVYSPYYRDLTCSWRIYTPENMGDCSAALVEISNFQDFRVTSYDSLNTAQNFLVAETISSASDFLDDEQLDFGKLRDTISVGNNCFLTDGNGAMSLSPYSSVVRLPDEYETDRQYRSCYVFSF